MKKPIFPILLVITLAVGGYFLFFHEGTPPEAGENSPNGNKIETASTANENGEASGKEKVKEKPKTRDQIEAEIRAREARNPQDYLKLNYSFKKKLLGGGYTATGTVFNDSEETYYKNTEVRMYFIDGQKVRLDSVSEILFDEYGPGDEVSFDLEHDSPKGTKMVELVVIGAEVSE